MYLYIYDSFLSEPKYEKVLSTIERTVTDLDIKGKIARLTILKNIKELVTDAVKGGVTTVVAIGDDQTFSKMINIVADLKVTLGLIPVMSDSKIARALGIPPKELACDVLAARIIRKIDLGKINNYFFINSLEINNSKITIDCDGYSLAPTTEQNKVRICNVCQHDMNTRSNPTDGVLEAVITPVKSSLFSRKQLQSTILPFTKIQINSPEEGVSIVTDQQVVLKTPAEIEIVPKKLSVIVGSKREFE
jgi:diacylglycerol kinase family enzyme